MFWFLKPNSGFSNLPLSCRNAHVSNTNPIFHRNQTENAKSLEDISISFKMKCHSNCSSSVLHTRSIRRNTLLVQGTQKLSLHFTIINMQTEYNYASVFLIPNFVCNPNRYAWQDEQDTDILRVSWWGNVVLRGEVVSVFSTSFCRH